MDKIEAMARAMLAECSGVGLTMWHCRGMARAAWNALIELERADKERRRRRVDGPFTPINTPFLEARKRKRGEIVPD